VKAKWLPAMVVFAVVTMILIAKSRLTQPPAGPVAEGVLPKMLLVATPEEAVSPTRCGGIVRLVRAAAQRGIRVQELTPDSRSELIAHYRVFRTPTVLIFSPGGTVHSRFEGEEVATLEALRREIQGMNP